MRAAHNKVAVSLVLIVIHILLGVGLAVLLVEWAVGCGEHYIDAHGEIHYYPCAFFPDREQSHDGH